MVKCARSVGGEWFYSEAGESRGCAGEAQEQRNVFASEELILDREELEDPGVDARAVVRAQEPDILAGLCAKAVHSIDRMKALLIPLTGLQLLREADLGPGRAIKHIACAAIAVPLIEPYRGQTGIKAECPNAGGRRVRLECAKELGANTFSLTFGSNKEGHNLGTIERRGSDDLADYWTDAWYPGSALKRRERLLA